MNRLTHTRRTKFIITAMSLVGLQIAAAGSTWSGNAFAATKAKAGATCKTLGATDNGLICGQKGNKRVWIASSLSSTVPSTAAPAATSSPTTTVRPAQKWPLTADTPQLPTKFRDYTNNLIEVSNIDRLAVLQGDMAEILWTIGMFKNVVIVDTTSVYPKEYLAQKPNAGFFRTLNVEAILKQNPSAIFVHRDAGPPQAILTLRAAGVPVVIVPELNGRDVYEAVEKIRYVSKAVGQSAVGENLAREVKAQIDEAVAKGKTYKSSPAVAYAVARGTQVFLTGMDNPSNAMITAAGATPVAKILKMDRATQLTPEALIAAQPEYIISTFTSVAQAGGEKAFLSIPGIAQTPAGKNGKLIVLDDTMIQQYGPRTGQAIVEVARRVHPDEK